AEHAQNTILRFTITGVASEIRKIQARRTAKGPGGIIWVGRRISAGGIKHDLNLCVVAAEDGIGVRRAARLRVAIDGDVIVRDERVTADGCGDYVRSRPGNVESDQI